MAKRIFGRERLRKLLETDREKLPERLNERELSRLSEWDDFVRNAANMVRVEHAHQLTPHLIREILDAVRIEHALQTTPATAANAFHGGRPKVYAKSREMYRGTRACLMRPLSLEGDEAFKYAKMAGFWP